jgi:hypothetical protein
VRRLKASIPLLHTNSNESYNFDILMHLLPALVHLKKSSGGPKGLIGPPCHGALTDWQRGRSGLEGSSVYRRH